MAGELISAFKILNLPFEPDFLCDYNYFMGDMNYRFNSTYEEIINNDLLRDAPKLIKNLDQLTKSMKGEDLAAI